ncbi:MAG TPA: hypothetical protein VFB34_00805 [Chloroflexota bacterium]|nr:hypothetical protein [Chloroflexota bacterium]
MTARGIVIAVGVLSLVGLTAGGAALARGGPTGTAHASPAGDYAPGPLSAYGIRFTSEPSSQAVMGESQAISDATPDSQATASNGQLLSGVEATAQYGLFSDDAYGHGSTSSGGFQASYQNVPVWIVTFSGPGLSLPSVGGPRAPGGSGSSSVHHEQNIVIDAETGAELLEFD